jgi:peptidoglycan/LPS O-acetylase OafA/YrhL
MTTQNPTFARRSDLDALRAVAMLLGIVLHAALSFFPSFWMVTDRSQNDGFAVVFSAIHGFRMPLFFVMSGFFSAMLLSRRGCGALVKHRFFRVFLPLVAGLFTLVPLTNWVSTIAMSSAASKPATSGGPADLWAASAAGDLGAIERYLANGSSINASGGKLHATPLSLAALSGRSDAIELLLRRGADVNATAVDGGTALHAAAFLGHDKAVTILVRHGAKVNAVNKRGETPLNGAMADEGTTQYIASLIEVPLDAKGLGGRKTAIAEFLRQHGAVAGKSSGLADLLMQFPLFNHLWFLWFLWWLVLGLAGVSALGGLVGIGRWFRPGLWGQILVVSPARYLWLIPLTMLPQSLMGEGGESPIFGPDTSGGLLPIPHVFAYYAIFFGFGALYYGCDDAEARTGKHWWLPLSLALAVVLPLGLTLVGAEPGSSALGLDPQRRRLLSLVLQSAYPWLMTFGLMGLFRRFSAVESPRMRYLSDSAYWLYLAHLPLIIWAQYLVRDLPLPALVKFVLIVVVSTAFLLWTYEYLVRYTWLGRFLNGPRQRPAKGNVVDLELSTTAAT